MGRLNAFRLNVYEQTWPVYINGAPIVGGAGQGLLIEGAQVVHALNDEADTAAFTARSWQPYAGDYIAVYSGDLSPERQLFGGRIIETKQRYLSKAANKNVVTDIRCVDPTWLLTRWKVRETYIGQSATAIVTHIINTYTQTFGTLYVQAGLPVIQAITFDNENVDSALTEICKQIGAYWFVDYQQQVHVFTVSDKAANGMTQAAAGDSGDHAITEDISQVATRIIGLGGGVGAAVDVPAGAAEVPLELGVAGGVQWYPDAGGIVHVAAQRVTYAQVRGNTGRGAILGTGNAPSSAPALAPTAGAGLGTGTYQYAITHITAAGETLIGPAAAAQTGAASYPTVNAFSVRASAYNASATYYPANANIQWRIAIYYQGGGYSLGPQTGFINTGTKWPEVGVGPIAYDAITGHAYPSWLLSSCPAQITQIVFYRTSNGATTVHFWDALNGVSSGVNGWLMLTGDIIDADLNVQATYPPPLAGGTLNRVTVTLPAVSSPSVTSRGLFRTAVNGAALKRVTNIAAATATYVDAIPDASLGAAPPATDTSLLREDGQIAAGATSALVTDTTPFVDDGGAAGGWATIGNLVVRYGGISGSSLVGIPPSGTGSVTATVRYGAQVLVQPRLVGIPASGVGALTQGARKGDTVAIRLEIEDVAAMQAMADRLRQSGNIYAGLIEYVVNDSRLGVTELLAVLQATLAERKDPIQTLTYWTRDDTHEIGRLVSVNLTTPNAIGTFRIKRVTFSEIAIAGARTTIRPKRTIEATNKLYTFSDLLRQIRGRDAGAR